MENISLRTVSFLNDSKLPLHSVCKKLIYFHQALYYFFCYYVIENSYDCLHCIFYCVLCMLMMLLPAFLFIGRQQFHQWLPHTSQLHSDPPQKTVNMFVWLWQKSLPFPSHLQTQIFVPNLAADRSQLEYTDAAFPQLWADIFFFLCKGLTKKKKGASVCRGCNP